MRKAFCLDRVGRSEEPRASWISAITTKALSRARRNAIARPQPLPPAPVTIATLSISAIYLVLHPNVRPAFHLDSPSKAECKTVTGRGGNLRAAGRNRRATTRLERQRKTGFGGHNLMHCIPV